jgi:3-hydroxyisobutyrate dehydrogenase
MAAKTSVAVLGLGIMGTGMATRLLGHQFDVTVYNRSPERTEGLAKNGAKVARTAREAAAAVSVVISMVADDDAARGVWLGNDGALAGAKPGTILMECSTVTPGWIAELAALARKAGCELLDAPVTGSKPQAMAGELVFLVGGKDSVLDQVRPVIATMSKEIKYLGPTGSGAKMKLINNFMCGAQAVALAESIVQIEKLGLNLETAVSVLAGGAPGSPFVKTAAARMLAKNFEPNFMLKWMAKDMRYANSLAGEMDICSAVIRTLERGIAAGYGEKDFSALVEALRENATTAA